MNSIVRKFLRPILLAGAVVIAAGAVILPGSAGSAASKSVEVPITFGSMVVNGTVVDYPTVPGATLNGDYDPETGTFSGNLVIPTFAVSDMTSVLNDFTLIFPPVNTPVTGTIPQSGTGSLVIGGWTVGILLPDDAISIESECTVTIGATTMTSQFNALDGTLALTGGLEIPGSICTGFEPTLAPAGAGNEFIVDTALAIPTSNASLSLGSNNASALLGTPARPAFTG